MNSGLELYAAQLEALIERIPDAVYIGDMTGIIRCNDTALSMLGYDSIEQLNRPVGHLARQIRTRDAATGRPLSGDEQPFSIALRGTPWVQEVIATNIKTGSDVMIRCAAAPIWRGGKVIGAVAVNTDITERRRAEQALGETSARLASALEITGLATWHLDLATGEVGWDEHLASMLGFPAKKMNVDAKFWQRMIHPEDRARVVREYLGETGPGAKAMEIRLTRQDGAERWFACHGRTIRDKQGRPTRIVGTAQDITERKRSEERMKLLAAEVDHRAKNMLALVNVMLRQTRAASITEFAGAAQGRVAALARAHTLLSDSRWEGADLEKLIREELAPFRLGKSGRIVLEGESVALSPAAAQSVAMALHELATNAGKYGALSRPDGAVSVRWQFRNSGLTLCWRETGGPRPTTTRDRGFGLTVIELAIRNQLNGTVAFDWRPDGLRVEFNVPAGRLRAGPSTSADDSL
jgi:PAS domain S-box-containing protein